MCLAPSQLPLLLGKGSMNMKRVTDIFGDVWEKLLVIVLEILQLFIPRWRYIIQKPTVFESKEDLSRNIVPISVNYHLTRQCNYKCGFCFHTATTSFVLPLEEAKKGLRLLKEEGMQKINFSGGEPFLPDRGCFLGELVYYCKEELSLPSVTIVSNGSTISEAWFKKYGSYLDILAISCDSFNEETNCNIGRGRGTHIKKLMKIRDWCNRYNVAFKINTVVNMENIEEDMSENILALRPVRWKVFQCLLLKGENVGENALRNAEKFYVTDQQFQKFLERHQNVPVLVPESNQKMRFLDCRKGDKKPSPSILDIGVKDALNFSGFDEKMFKKRGGVYKWSKANMDLDW